MNILLVDDDEDFTEIIEYVIKKLFPFDVVFYVANSGHNAIEILKISKIDLCICDHNMPNGMGDTVLKYILNDNQKTKFVLCSTFHPAELPDLYPHKNMFYNIQKPDVYSGIEKLYKLIVSDSSATDDKNDFTPLTPNFLLFLGVTPADIYIRISSSKFVKYLNKNTPFDSADFDKCRSKFLTKLFILRDDDKKSIDPIISSAISKLMDNSELSLNSRLSIAHNQLSEMIKSRGMNSGLAEITNKNIKQSVSIIIKNNILDNFWKDISPLGEYSSDLYALHSMLASTVAQKLVWNTEASIFQLIMATFLQDATLNSATLIKVYNYRHFLEIQKTLNKDEVKTFTDHPQATKEMISFFKERPNDIDRILLEQYEMPDGSGFPQKINANRLSPLTCVFILTGILARYILADGPSFQLKDFLKEFEAEGYSKGNFKESFLILKSMQA